MKAECFGGFSDLRQDMEETQADQSNDPKDISVIAVLKRVLI